MENLTTGHYSSHDLSPKLGLPVDAVKKPARAEKQPCFVCGHVQGNDDNDVVLSEAPEIVADVIETLRKYALTIKAADKVLDYAKARLQVIATELPLPGHR
jgi:hypothetical protein